MAWITAAFSFLGSVASIVGGAKVVWAALFSVLIGWNINGFIADRRVNIVERQTIRRVNRECRRRCDCPGFLDRFRGDESEDSIDAFVRWWYQIKPIASEVEPLESLEPTPEPTLADPRTRIERSQDAADIRAAKEAPNAFGWADPKEIRNANDRQGATSPE